MAYLSIYGRAEDLLQSSRGGLSISNRPLPLIFQKLCWIRRYDKVYYIRACFSIKKAAISFIAAFLYKAGTEGLEPSTFGFGDQRSTN